jgi:hypothetical protein
MSLPNSLHAYISELDAFDRASKSDKGIRIEMPSFSKARHYANRLNYARKLDRTENAKVLDEDMPMHGKSDYDCFMVSVKEDTAGCWWVYIEKNDVIPGEVEEL